MREEDINLSKEEVRNLEMTQQAEAQTGSCSDIPSLDSEDWLLQSDHLVQLATRILNLGEHDFNSRATPLGGESSNKN